MRIVDTIFGLNFCLKISNMEYIRWMEFYILCIALISIVTANSTSTPSENMKNYGNRIKRERAHRERKSNKKSEDGTVIDNNNRVGRQASPPQHTDPKYDFSFHTPEYSRREMADDTGRVKGLYSFVDDVGENHLVRYAASAEHGFEVFNSVPDLSRYVQYGAPLFKASPNVRGRIAYERGPAGQYKFISSGPDQRRSESIGPDGVTRGAFSYLDDKGSQRSTQYIAGAGIGYRVVQDTVGPQTHLLPRPANVEVGILYSRNRGVIANDFPHTSGFDNKGGDDNAINGHDVLGGTHGDDRDDNDGFGGFDWEKTRPSDNFHSNPSQDGSYTIITNYGNKFFGIPPGASVRAHVQNIDLKPFGEISLSPGEALRRAERRFRL